MENNLLFINQNKDIIQEFLEAMEGREGPMEIDTADSGLEAAFLLKKKKYKVVITGLDLPTYDGTKIIEYLNINYPRTVCIVYTWRLELAHVKLLVNERKVFRIFQRPMSYFQMYGAIMDGFIKYDRKEADALERRELEQNLKKASVKAAMLKRVAVERSWEKKELVKFLHALLNVFVRDVESELSGQEKWKLIEYERKVLFRLLEKEGGFPGKMEEVRRDIYKHFLHPERDQQVVLDIDSCPKEMDPYFCTNLHFIIWLLLTRFEMVSWVFHVKMAVMPVNQERFRVRVEAVFPEKVWGEAHEARVARVMTGVTQNILECFADRFNQSISDEKVVYYMEVAGRQMAQEDAALLGSAV